MDSELSPPKNREKTVFPHHPSNAFIIDPQSLSQEVTMKHTVAVAGESQSHLFDLVL